MEATEQLSGLKREDLESVLEAFIEVTDDHKERVQKGQNLRSQKIEERESRIDEILCQPVKARSGGKIRASQMALVEAGMNCIAPKLGISEWPGSSTATVDVDRRCRGSSSKRRDMLQRVK